MNYLIFISIFYSITAFAGGGSDIGNGGIGIQCNDAVELFDLYEGRVLNQDTPVEIPSSYRDRALSYANHLTEVTGGDIQFYDDTQDILKSLIFLPKGVGLTLTDDANSFIYPKDCKLVQILNYRADGFVYIDSELWERLSETGKAAAILHEVIYKVLRTPDYLAGQIADGDRNSLRTRRIVSHLIAGKTLEPVHTLNGDNAKTVWNCKNSNPSDLTTIFYVYENAGQTKVEFSFLNGSRMITNSSFSVSWPFKEFGSKERIKSIVDWDINVLIQSLSTRIGDDR
ncbi:MAG: hypothetical protein ACXVCP_16680, partial [Bdellovibrio sp.]